MDKAALNRANRIAALRADLGKLDAKQLGEAAQDAGADLVGDETREEIEFATAEAMVNAKDAEDARLAAEAAAAKAKAEREAFYQTKEGKKQRAIDEAAARDDAVRKVNAAFISGLPHDARMLGSHVVPESRSGSHPVPDGRYRVLGSFWVMSFKDGKWIGADQGHARAEPDWIEIPDVPGGLVGGKHAPAKDW